MKDTPPWWWKLGWTLEEATPKPKPLMTPGNASGNLREKTASKAGSVISEARRDVSGKKGACAQDALPKPKGFWPSKTKKAAGSRLFSWPRYAASA